MTDLYPEIEPYDHGMLEVDDGNLAYWEACGNPRGKPAVVLHGGPGSGCSPPSGGIPLVRLAVIQDVLGAGAEEVDRDSMTPYYAVSASSTF